MLKVKIKGNPSKILKLMEELGEDTISEIFISVNNIEELVPIINKSISYGLVVEITPSNTQPLHHSTVREGSIKKSIKKPRIEETDEVNNLLKKYKKKKAKKQEVSKTEKQEPKIEEKEHEKEEGTSKVREENIEEHVEEIGANQPEEERVKREKNREDTEQEEEIGFEELVKLKEEAFSRKIVG